MPLPPLFRIETLIDACERGELVLTANQRIRRKAIEAWGQYQSSQGNTVWRPPRLYTLEHWFQKCWHSLQLQHFPGTEYLIAKPVQQNLFWENIIKEDDEGLLQTDVIAKQAATAYRNLLRWNLKPDCLDSYGAKQHNTIGLQQQQFQTWCQRFEAMLEARQLILDEHSYPIIGRAFEEGKLQQEALIHLLGFDDIPPLIQTQLAMAAQTLQKVKPQDYKPQTCIRVQCQTQEAEMDTAAKWAKSILENQAHARIGIILPNLGQSRDDIERALIHNFESHSLLPSVARYTYPFNISAGTPLSTTPLIQSTLQLLRLGEKSWPVDTLCQLLMSPFWGKYTKEYELRCRLADKISRLGVFDIDIGQVRYWAEALSASPTPETTARETMADETITGEAEESGQGMEGKVYSLFPYFEALRQLKQTLKNRYQLPSAWVAYFKAHLACLNWPGERRPDSHEYQQTELWYQVLESFCGLDDTVGTISMSEALYHCQNLAKHQPFQPKVPDSPIQVLGILEGAGLSFTHCWILGLDQQNWPPAPQPNPLLPSALQRQHNMPHASSLRELAFAESLTAHYRQCAEHIVFSSPLADESGEQIKVVSHLIEDIPLTSIPEHIASNTFEQYRAQLKASQQWETIDCQRGPAVSERDKNEHGELSGGANLLKAQANNPFDAFVQYRLHARPPLRPESGFSPIEKGNILHQSLAVLWQDMVSQSHLLALSEEELEDKIRQSVATQVAMIQRQKPWHLGDQVCTIEIERQTRLLLNWFNTVEKQRPPFEVVAVEESSQISLLNSQFTLRLDRVDRLADGRFLIIDYKTGNTAMSHWTGERIKDPQLPLYLVTREQAVSGIAFAEINISKCCFKGLCEEYQESDTLSAPAGVEPIDSAKVDLPPTWEAAKAEWQQQLVKILTDFLEGDCKVNYRDSVAAQYGAEFHAVNRLYDQFRLKPN